MPNTLKPMRKHNPGSSGSLRTDFLCVLFLFLGILVYYQHLLFPNQQLIVTPDFGRTDSWHESIASKYVLWQNLKQHRLPLWVDAIGNGFPYTAEGHPGSLFLPNLIFYTLFSFVTAYNLSQIFTVFVFAAGMYAWTRTAGMRRTAAVFAGFTAAYSGVIIPQLVHMTHLQGLTLIPWLFFFTHRMAKGNSPLAWAGLVLTGSQQVFTGFPQAVLIGFLFAVPYYLWIKRTSGKLSWRREAANFLVLATLWLGSSAAQLLPTFEFARFSTTRYGFSPKDASFFSYPIKQFLTMINPFQLGNPRDGTYPDFQSFYGSIFWENSAFIGWLPLVLIAGALLMPKLRKKILGNQIAVFLLAAISASVLLMMGSRSPIYIIYSFWPFNLFRVPSRFIWAFEIFMIVLSAMIIDGILKEIRSRILLVVVIILISVNTTQMAWIWKGYHLVAPSSWLRKPDTFVKDGQGVFIFGYNRLYNDVFLKKGWKDPTPYASLAALPIPNANLFWNTRTLSVYAGRALVRQVVPESLILEGYSESEGTATISATAKTMLRTYGVGWIYTPDRLSDPDLRLLNTISDTPEPVYVYKLSGSVPKAFLVENLIKINGISELSDAVRSDKFQAGSSAIVESDGISGCKHSGRELVSVITWNEIQKKIRIQNLSCPTMLVVGNAYYPSWIADVDGIRADIQPANINQQGIIVPSGNHTVTLSLRSQSFIQGVVLTVISYISVFAVAAYQMYSRRLYTRA